MILPRDSSAPAHAVFYFDFLSPEAYLASGEVSRFAAITGAHLTWEPVQAGHLQPGVLPSPDWDYLQHQAREGNLLFEIPRRYPFDSGQLLRTCVFVRERSGQEAMTAVAERLWRQVWGQGEDPEDLATAIRAGKEVALPEEVLRAGIEAPGTALILGRLTARAAARGVRIVPALFVHGSLFSGLGQMAEAERILRSDVQGFHSSTSGECQGPDSPGDIPDWTFSG